MLCLQMKNLFLIHQCDLPGVLRAAVLTVTKKVAGVPSPACKIGLHPSQQPLVVNPYSNIWRPLDVVALVLMTILLSSFHKVYELQVHSVHKQLYFGRRNMVAGIINPEQFLEDQVPV